MTDTRNRKDAVTMRNLAHGGSKGAGLNRECSNCQPPCQGGEILHRKGPCCHSYCPCEGFEPVGFPPISGGVLGKRSTATGAQW